MSEPGLSAHSIRPILGHMPPNRHDGRDQRSADTGYTPRPSRRHSEQDSTGMTGLSQSQVGSTRVPRAGGACSIGLGVTPPSPDHRRCRRVERISGRPRLVRFRLHASRPRPGLGLLRLHLPARLAERQGAIRQRRRQLVGVARLLVSRDGTLAALPGLNPFILLEKGLAMETTGIEPATCCLQSNRSPD
jgi:hypothetical protein